MILIIDNTKNLKNAYMTPKLIKILEDNNLSYIIASERKEVNNILNNSNNISCAILSGIHFVLLVSVPVAISLQHQTKACTEQRKCGSAHVYCTAHKVVIKQHAGGAI